MLTFEQMKARTTVETPSGCWEWTRTIGSHGYGGLTVDSKVWTAHRYMATLVFGPIPKGMYVLHRCDNRPCINPDHLWLGTQTENMSDARAKGRWRPSDHEYPRGSQVKTSVLTEAQVEQMRAEHAAGASMRSLSHKFGVSPATAQRVCRREGWRHVA